MYNSNLHTSPLGIKLIHGFEKCRLTAYDDKQPNKVLKRGDKVLGHLTIGWGSTMLHGRPVRIGDKISQAEADELFNKQLPKYESMVRDHVKRDLLPHEMDACVSFCYNAGTSYKSGGIWRPFNLWTNINNRLCGKAMYDYWTACAITSGGVKMGGLIRRRKSEVTLYLTGVVDFFE